MEYFTIVPVMSVLEHCVSGECTTPVGVLYSSDAGQCVLQFHETGVLRLKVKAVNVNFTFLSQR